MAKQSFSDCFKRYGARLSNPMWAVSAQAMDGAIVLSCCSHYFSRPNATTLRYSDKLSRWAGNTAGNKLPRDHLELARAQALPVRLIVATADSTAAVDAGWEGSQIKKTFHVKPDLVGRVIAFDGDEFVVDFASATPKVGAP